MEVLPWNVHEMLAGRSLSLGAYPLQSFQYVGILDPGLAGRVIEKEYPSARPSNQLVASDEWSDQLIGDTCELGAR
jgi:hypothetical protein